MARRDQREFASFAFPLTPKTQQIWPRISPWRALLSHAWAGQVVCFHNVNALPQAATPRPAATWQSMALILAWSLKINWSTRRVKSALGQETKKGKCSKSLQKLAVDVLLIDRKQKKCH
jgi:hypothetical protein